MTQSLIHALAALLLAGAALACGKYGPPERLPVAAPAGEPSGESAAPPVDAGPQSSAEPAQEESCEEAP